VKVLIDECAPKAPKKHLTNQGHERHAVQEVGWSGKQNGELLSLAEAAFDVLVTADTNLRYQQNLAGRRIAIVILYSSSNRLEHLRQHFPACVVGSSDQSWIAILLIRLAFTTALRADFGPDLGLIVPKLFPRARLHPYNETVFDGHTCRSLSFLPVSRESRGSGEGGDAAPFPHVARRL
jgi:predicted nuclease of predicted toxin-antitoxin system